jgi:hypothetical protein
VRRRLPRLIIELPGRYMQGEIERYCIWVD